MNQEDTEISLLDQLLADPAASRELAVADFTITMEGLLYQAFEARPDVTVSDLARAVGVTESRVVRILEGDDVLRFETFVRYLHVLGFKPDLTMESIR
jgi:hypothetical protein